MAKTLILAFVSQASRRLLLTATAVGVALLVTVPVYADSATRRVSVTVVSSPCETVTDRPNDEVIVPLGDDETPRLPAKAVRILPGESLCITGKVLSDGSLVDIRLVREGPEPVPAVFLHLERGETTILSVHHTADRHLSYRAASIVTEQNLALPTSTVVVPPELESYESWGREVRQTLLYGFRFFDRAEHYEPEPDPGFPTPEDRTLGFTFGLGLGEREVRPSVLDDGLRRDGFPPLRSTRIIGAFDMDFHIWRARAGVTLAAGGATTKHPETGAEVSTWLGEIGFTTGFDVLRFKGFTAFLGTGILVGNFFVDARTEGLTLFEDHIEPWEGDRVNWSHWAFPVELGAEYLVPLGQATVNEYWAVQFGTRIGRVMQLTGNWETDEDEDSRDIRGLPDIDVTGMTYRLILGIGLFNEPARAPISPDR